MVVVAAGTALPAWEGVGDFAATADGGTVLPLGDLAALSTTGGGSGASLSPAAAAVAVFDGPTGVYPLFRASGFAYELSFDTALGAVPALQADASALAGANANVTVDGGLLPGVLPLAATLGGFPEGVPVYVRVAASNSPPGPGLGPFSAPLAWAVPVGRPDAPRLLRAAPARRVYETQDVVAVAQHQPAVQALTTSATVVAEVQMVRTAAEAPGAALAGGGFALTFNGIASTQGFAEITLLADAPLAHSTGAFALRFGASNASACVGWDAAAEPPPLPPAAGSAVAALDMLNAVVGLTTVDASSAAIALADDGSLRVKREELSAAELAAAGAVIDGGSGGGGSGLVGGAAAYGVRLRIFLAPAVAAAGNITVVSGSVGGGGCSAFAPAAGAGAPTVAVSVTAAMTPARPLFAADASADAVAANLGQHPDIIDVNVLRSLAASGGGYYWTVAFAQVANDGPPCCAAGAFRLAADIPLMDCDASALVPATAAPTCTVTTEVPRNTLGGSLYFTLPPLPVATIGVAAAPLAGSASVPWDATADAVAAAVTSLLDFAAAPAVPPVTATRSSAPDAAGGFTWTLTFAGVNGIVPPLGVVTALTGAGANAKVAVLAPGNALGGSFSLFVGGRAETLPISVNASAGELAAALQALGVPPAQPVTVTAGLTTAGAPGEGTTWAVTLSQPGDLAGSAGLTVGNTALLSGSGAAIYVREAVKGAHESGTALAFTFLPPGATGGLPISAIEIEWDVSPAFAAFAGGSNGSSSSSSSGGGSSGTVILSSADCLLRKQTITLTAGDGYTGGADIAGGTWRVSYGAGGPASAALPHNASATAVRDALQALPGIGAASVVRDVARLLLLDAAAGSSSGGAGVPIFALPHADYAERVVLSAAPTAAQLAVGDAVWLVGEDGTCSAAGAFRVRGFAPVDAGAAPAAAAAAAVAAASGGGSVGGVPVILLLGSSAAPGASTPAFVSPDLFPDTAAAGYVGDGALLVYRAAGGFAWTVTVHTAMAAAGAAPSAAASSLSAFFAPAHSLVAREASLGGTQPPPLSVAIAMASPACVVYTPAAQPLAAGRAVYLRAWARNAFSRSAVPSAVTRAVPRTTPAAPAAVAVDALSDSQLLVRWADPPDDGAGGAAGAGIDAFVLQWDGGPAFASGGGGPPAAPASSVWLPRSALLAALAQPAAVAAAAGYPAAAPWLPPLPYAYTLSALAGVPLTNGTRVFVRVLATAAGAGYDSNAAWAPPQAFADTRAWAAPVPAAAATAFTAPAAPPIAGLQLLSTTAVRMLVTLPARTGGTPLAAIEVQTAADAAFGALSGVASRVAPLATLPALASPAGAVALVDIGGLATGTPVYARARVLSAGGLASGWTATTPAVLTPCGPPGPPVSARLAASPPQAGAPVTSAALAWAPPADDGGMPVTGYLVEWWSDARVIAAARLSVHNTLGADDTLCTGAGAGSAYCALTLAYGGAATPPFPLDESAADLRRMLMTLAPPSGGGAPLLNQLDVVRTPTRAGYNYDIAFTGRPGGAGLGAVGPLAIVSLAARSQSNCGGSSGGGGGGTPCISVLLEARGAAGRRRYGRAETQVVALLVDDGGAGAWAPTGYFSLAPGGGPATAALPAGAPAADVQAALLALPAVRAVTVTLAALAGAAAVVSASAPPALAAVNATAGAGSVGGWLYTLTYTAAQGDVPGLALDASQLAVPVGAPHGAVLVAIASDGDAGAVAGPLAAPACGTCAQGELPADYTAAELSRDARALLLANLTAGRRVYATVSAVNARGAGPAAWAACDPPGAAYCEPDPTNAEALAVAAANGATLGYLAGSDAYGVMPPQLVPGPPTRASLAVDAGLSTQLLVSYGPPAADGGSPVLAYRIDWSPAADFSGAGGGSLDVPCAGAAAAHRVFAVRTANTNSSADGLDGGTFALALSASDGGPAWVTNAIRWDADAAAGWETDAGGSRIFCEKVSVDPASSPVVPCVAPLSFAPDAPGSLQSQLETLPPLAAGGLRLAVTVTPGGAPGEFVWRVTFPPAPRGGSWTLAPAPSTGGGLLNVVSGAPGAVAVAMLAAGDAAAAPPCVGTQTLAGLVQGLPYYARVTAYNALGFGAPVLAVAPATGLPYQAPMRAPGRPTAVALTVKSGTELRVTWLPPADDGGDAVTAYIVDYGTALDAASGAPAGATGSVTLTYLPDGGPYSRVLGRLTAGTPYYVLVSAVNSQGAGAGQQSTPTAAFPCAAPKAPMSVRLGVTRDTMLTVAFAPPLDDGGAAVTAYRVEWDTDPQWAGAGRLPAKGSVTVAAAAAASYTVTGLAPGGTYYVRVAAGNAIGFGAPTADSPAGRTTAPQPPGKPYDIAAATATGAGLCASIALAWTPPLIPAHGLFCGGGGAAAPRAPAACPAGMGVASQADGGARIAAYEVQYATLPDFSDAVAVIVPVAPADQAAPIATTLGPGSAYAMGALPMLAGQPYFLRIAARNAAGTGPFCARADPLCDGAPLVAVAGGPCGAATRSRSPAAAATPSPSATTSATASAAASTSAASSASATESATASISASTAASPTTSATAAASTTASETATASASATAATSSSAASSVAVTTSSSAASTHSASATASAAATSSSSVTASATATASSSATASATATTSSSATASATATTSSSATASATAT